MRIGIVTVSDRASRGEYDDLSGPEMETAFSELVPGAEIRRLVVPDDEDAIVEALESLGGFDWVFTTGGTGPAPRDVTPEATRRFIDREAPGLAEYLRLESLKETSHAVFSRGIAGMRGACYVVNAPGSVKAARLCARVFAPLLEHGVAMASGKGH
ncbi:MAG TPA: MogA/MoaB family molybdenum cofactor biosynthesis protein [Spirochaetia bacterium]|nr:MogA/MoaB family molybdenum cofactor biosynthesis protein [Spirochaetales bacterium]HRW23018.1 MogA/MoaB family molybdenum cofactor biosynthesis protein [Spirochaetia bacterium]